VLKTWSKAIRRMCMLSHVSLKSSCRLHIYKKNKTYYTRVKSFTPIQTLYFSLSLECILMRSQVRCHGDSVNKYDTLI
jgi:hypothetical protein